MFIQTDHNDTFIYWESYEHLIEMYDDPGLQSHTTCMRCILNNQSAIWGLPFEK